MDLVEPSTALLQQASDALTRQGLDHRAHAATIEDFTTDHHDGRWDLAQSTFALQSLPPQQRRPVLRWLAQRTRALAVVEFDVAHVPDPFDPDWFRDCASRLERGLREYENERDLVGSGFIIPVILGHFATHPHQPRTLHPGLGPGPGGGRLHRRGGPPPVRLLVGTGLVHPRPGPAPMSSP